MPATDFERSVRAARISAVEISNEWLGYHRASAKDWRGALDHALWEAQRAGIEIRLLASLTGYTAQAIYQAIERAKRAEEERDDSDRAHADAPGPA